MTRTEYLLTCLAEECMETAQRASKAIRFSPTEIQPEQELTNAQRIVYEFNDIYAVMEILRDEGVIEKVMDRDAIELKKSKLEKYYAYARECGTVGNPLKDSSEVFDYINPALHQLHNHNPIVPNSREHELLKDLLENVIDMKIYNCIVLKDDLFNHWATWFEEEKKTIETRFYFMKYRGDLIICCGKKSMTKNKGKAVCIVNLFDAVPMAKEHEEKACIEAVPGRVAHLTNNLRHFSRKFEFSKRRVSGSFQSIFQITLPDDVQILGGPVNGPKI
jgi:hypothetical protein